MSKCYASAVVAVAIGELGYVEKASNSQLDNKTANPGSANWTKYARDFDEKYPKWYNGKKNGHEWCDMFVDWCHLTAFGYWEPQIRDEEDGKPVYGLTDFADDGSVAVFVKPSLEVADAVEVLAHELAHVAVGVEHDHDEVWQEAFDKIFEEYNRIGSQMFPDREDSAMDDPDEK